MGNEVAIIPFQDLRAMADVMGKTGMFGKSPDQLLSLMLIAQAEGIHPAIAAQEYDIIQGKPAINTRAALARFQAAGGCIQWIVRNDTEVRAVFSHPQGGQLEIGWTMERAVQAGLAGKDNWKKYPAQMLSARVISEGVRAIYPACLSRLYTVEEVQDFDLPKERNVTEPVHMADFRPLAATDQATASNPVADAIKAEIGHFVEIMGTMIDGDPAFTDEEKAEAKKKIAATPKDLDEKLKAVKAIVATVQSALDAKKGTPPPMPEAQLDIF